MHSSGRQAAADDHLCYSVLKDLYEIYFIRTRPAQVWHQGTVLYSEVQARQNNFCMLSRCARAILGRVGHSHTYSEPGFSAAMSATASGKYES